MRFALYADFFVVDEEEGHAMKVGVRKQSFELVVRLRLSHRPGQFARVAAHVAKEGALLGDIRIIERGDEEITRDVTIEANDEAHGRHVIEGISALDGIEYVSTRDPVFDVHSGGKLAVVSTTPIETVEDLRHIYTPGVARVTKAIAKDPQLAWQYTGMGRTLGIFTNGTRVLGLGDVGPLASLPVMEGKAALYARFANLSAFPLVVAEKDPQAFVDLVVRLSSSFGAIHLEDIRAPDCYEIEDALIERLEKPVMHDDQHGTATAALAALISVANRTGMDLSKATLGQIGLGAAGSAIAKLALEYGLKEVLVSDVNEVAVKRVQAWGAVPMPMTELVQKADIVIATTGRPGLIDPKLLRPGQIIFALSNPDPEIDPSAALEAGVRFASDGRTINNALAFPGIFRGVLDVRARRIVPQMLIAAAEAIAALGTADELVPSPLSPRVHEAVARAVADKARALGLDNQARA
jgi:malate dehydrogenase (oxaloacetate-decarboxylating)